eukprot:657087-Rhodomonas_salina.4
MEGIGHSPPSPGPYVRVSNRPYGCVSTGQCVLCASAHSRPGIFQYGRSSVAQNTRSVLDIALHVRRQIAALTGRTIHRFA